MSSICTVASGNNTKPITDKYATTFSPCSTKSKK